MASHYHIRFCLPNSSCWEIGALQKNYLVVMQLLRLLGLYLENVSKTLNIFTLHPRFFWHFFCSIYSTIRSAAAKARLNINSKTFLATMFQHCFFSVSTLSWPTPVWNQFSCSTCFWWTCRDLVGWDLIPFKRSQPQPMFHSPHQFILGRTSPKSVGL